MKKVITYGTYDLFHHGHRRLLERARELGDYLVVGVTTENYDDSRGKLNVHQNLMERIDNIKKCGLADEIIIEEYEGQKINDIQKYSIDIFAIGSDWTGKFDYLKEYCDVMYLDRTKGISSTELRNESNGILKLGMVGYGRIAKRFIRESKYVSGTNVEGVFGRNKASLIQFREENELNFETTEYNELLEKVDAIYIASPHLTHYEYAMRALLKGKHVLCEKPLALKKSEVIELYELANKNRCVFLEAVKTAYSPGFSRLVSLAKSGIIGDIKNVDATFTKLMSSTTREFDPRQAGGSVTELATYPLLAIVKLLGDKPIDKTFHSFFDEDRGVDLFTRINLTYKNAIATANIGIGVKSEGDLIISGTKGYIYVPAPWWKTEYFEVRYEDYTKNKKHYYKFQGDGLRYEIAEFVSLINNNQFSTYKLAKNDSIFFAEVIEEYRAKSSIIEI